LTYDETREELEWFLDGHPDRPELGLWATIDRRTGRFVGRCGLLPWTIEKHPEVEVAYMVSKEFWGQGLGTEAARAIARHGFEQLHLSRLICMIHPLNQASIRVACKVGMTFERQLEDDEGPFLLYSMGREALSSQQLEATAVAAYPGPAGARSARRMRSSNRR
jgi:RimJ/RimL family protein N-acetyltransferase